MWWCCPALRCVLNPGTCQQSNRCRTQQLLCLPSPVLRTPYNVHMLYWLLRTCPGAIAAIVSGHGQYAADVALAACSSLAEVLGGSEQQVPLVSLSLLACPGAHTHTRHVRRTRLFLHTCQLRQGCLD